ncbi:MAG: prepilin-type N-terminal cleavage/methylation domain-containing protein [Candidatus Omnitrophota bacterium]
MGRNNGFTLLELMVVLVIVGILATLGFVQYTAVIERGRAAEARANLGTLRVLQQSYQQDNNPDFGTMANLNSEYSTGLPTTGSACTNTGFFYGYSCDTANGSCTATRCTAGGKDPQGGGGTIALSTDGQWS